MCWIGGFGEDCSSVSVIHVSVVLLPDIISAVQRHCINQAVRKEGDIGWWRTDWHNAAIRNHNPSIRTFAAEWPPTNSNYWRLETAPIDDPMHRATLTHPSNAPITASAMSIDGTTAITGDRAGTIAVWNLSGFAVTRHTPNTPHTRRITDTTVSANGTTAITGDAAGTIAIWNLNDDRLDLTGTTAISNIRAVAISDRSAAIMSTGNYYFRLTAG